MKYVYKDGGIFDIKDIRAIKPNVSIPDGADLSDIGYHRVFPAIDVPELTKNSVLENLPPVEIEGVWREAFVVRKISISEQIKVFEQALDNHLDRVATQKRYADRVTCALRAGYPGPFQAEGKAFATWMDTCNAQAYALLAEVVAGQRELPDDPQTFLDMLPPMEWLL